MTASSVRTLDSLAYTGGKTMISQEKYDKLYGQYLELTRRITFANIHIEVIERYVDKGKLESDGYKLATR